MKRLRFAPILFKPSFSSFLGVLIFMGLFLIVAVWSNVVKSGLVYQYLLGPSSSMQLIQSARDTITAFSQTVFGNPILNRILFFVFWLFIGLLVYAFVSGIGLGVSAADHSLHELQYVNARKQQLKEDIRTRLVLRFVVLLSWIVYSLFFFKLILPFTMACVQVAVNPLLSLHGFLYGSLALVTLFIGLHLHVIWARLFFLKPRLFGGWDEIVSDLD